MQYSILPFGAIAALTLSLLVGFTSVNAQVCAFRNTQGARCNDATQRCAEGCPCYQTNLITGACCPSDSTSPGCQLDLGIPEGSSTVTSTTRSVSPSPISAPGYAIVEAADEARRVLDRSDRINLNKMSETGVNTAALQNIQDIADQTCAKTGLKKCVYLSPKLFQGMLSLSDRFSYSVSSIVGGDHCGSPNLKKKVGCKGTSNHYKGQAFDVSVIGTTTVAPKDGQSYKFMKACLAAGFIEVLGPRPLPTGASTNKGHADHVHCGYK